MFTLAHLSDPHLGLLPPVAWRALLNKRATGYVNWFFRRRHIHNMDVLSRLIADILSCHPDHVAMTGDVAHIGLDQEFVSAAGFMQRLGPPEHVSFVPGNHDAYIQGSLESCQRHLGAWMESDDSAIGFPWLKIRGKTALIGMNSGVPTAPFRATGTAGQDQLDRAEVLLHYAKSRGLVRVVLIHHAPHIGGSKSGRELTDAPQFEAMLARAGAELVLHGHNHAASIAHRPGPYGSVPIIGVASASGLDDGRHEKAAWHLIKINADESSPTITVTRRSPMTTGGFGEEQVLDLVART